MEKEKTSNREPEKRYHLRSSLKNKITTISTTTTENNHLTPHRNSDAPRRVSFASSSNVKPFINDPENNTIWHDSYEQEMNQVDSSNSEYLSLNKSSANFKVYNDNDDDELNHTSTSVATMDFTCIGNKNEEKKANRTPCAPEIQLRQPTIIYTETIKERELNCQSIKTNENYKNHENKTIIWDNTENCLDFTCQSLPSKQMKIDQLKNLENQTICGEQAMEFTMVKFQEEPKSDRIYLKYTEKNKTIESTLLGHENDVQHSVNRNVTSNETLDMECENIASIADEHCSLISNSISEDHTNSVEPIEVKNTSNAENVLHTEKIPKIIFSEALKLDEILPANVTEFLDVAARGVTFPPQSPSIIHSHQLSEIDIVEDTQQLIQAKILTPHITIESTEQIDIELKLESKSESKLELEPEPKLSSTEMEVNEIIKTIKTDLKLCNYKKLIDVNKMQQKIKGQAKYLNNVKQHLVKSLKPLPKCINLEEYTNQEKLLTSQTSTDISSNSSVNTDENRDNFLNFSLIEQLPANLSLHEKIINACEKLEITLERHKDSNYVFSIARSLILMKVKILPDEGPVDSFEIFCVLKDSADIALKYVIDNICKKLNEQTIKSALGESYDILSLLDYTFMIVDTHFDFLCNFTKLQFKYKYLKFNTDFSLSYEIINITPPICWQIHFNMLSPIKIDHDNLSVKSLYGHINEKQFKKIAEEIPAESTCLEQFLKSVYDYFKKELNKKSGNNVRLRK